MSSPAPKIPELIDVLHNQLRTSYDAAWQTNTTRLGGLSIAGERKQGQDNLSKLLSAVSALPIPDASHTIESTLPEDERFSKLALARRLNTMRSCVLYEPASEARPYNYVLGYRMGNVDTRYPSVDVLFYNPPVSVTARTNDGEQRKALDSDFRIARGWFHEYAATEDRMVGWRNHGILLSGYLNRAYDEDRDGTVLDKKVLQSVTIRADKGQTRPFTSEWHQGDLAYLLPSPTKFRMKRGWHKDSEKLTKLWIQMYKKSAGSRPLGEPSPLHEPLVMQTIDARPFAKGVSQDDWDTFKVEPILTDLGARFGGEVADKIHGALR